MKLMQSDKKMRYNFKLNAKEELKSHFKTV